MGLNESTVRVHLFRAVRKLRAVLDRESWTGRGVAAPGRRANRRQQAVPTGPRPAEGAGAGLSRKP